ncbi:MAG: glycosyltransferase family 39 protein [Acidobacteriota bacterium]|nr:glycosyltransferase family 39 protein [Acidobacteriota bacterium]
MRLRSLALLPTTTRGIFLATAGVLFLLLLIGAWRAYPLLDDVTAANSAGDDWLSYKRYALSILHEGLSLPAVRGSYYAPAGFLYSYFIAAVFALTGENSTHVYLVQAALLALSVGLTAAAFQPYLSITARAIYFWALALTLFLDVYLVYTFRLLSENLTLFLLPIFYLTLLRAFESQSAFLTACAGAALGLCALSRPNLVLVAPATAVLLFWRLRPRRTKYPLIFLLWFGVIFSLLPLRNYVAGNQLSVPVFTMKAHWQTPALDTTGPPTLAGFGRNAFAVATFYARRVLFCSGFTLLELPFYWLRPHWLVMWGGAFTFARRALRRRCLKFWELFALSFIPVYLLPIIALAQISNYGVRMIVPVIPIVLLLGVRALSPPDLFSAGARDQDLKFSARSEGSRAA